MYNAKIGPNPRIPNAEWAGCGFSRTHLSLFPQQEGDSASSAVRNDGGDSKAANGIEEEKQTSSSTAGAWTESDGATSTTNVDTKTGDGNNVNSSTSNKSKDCSSNIHQKPPLVPQQSNLLDFAASRTTIDRKFTDLPSLFIENGLEKYIRNYCRFLTKIFCCWYYICTDYFTQICLCPRKSIWRLSPH